MKLRNIVRSLRFGSHSPFRLRLIVVHVSLQFADSWSACITQSQSNSPSSSNSVDASSSNPQMKSFRGVVGSLTNFLLSPPKDAGHQKLQVLCSLLMTLVFFIVCFASFSSCLTGRLYNGGPRLCDRISVMRIKIMMFTRSSQQTILQL